MEIPNQKIKNAAQSIREVTQLTNEELRILHQIPMFRPLIQTFVVISTYLILANIGFWLHNWAIWLLVWFGQGFLFSCFLSAMHDCAHNSLYKYKFANRCVGTLWGLAMFINFSLYKYSHIMHHQQTKMKGVIKGNVLPWLTFNNISNYINGMINFYPLIVWKNWWNVTKGLYPEFIKTPMQRQFILRDNWFLLGWFVLMVGMTVTSPEKILFSYWIPLIFFAPPLAFIFTITEHYGCEFGSNQNEFNNTQTIISHPLFRYYYNNNNYHTEHHLYPSMPSYNYPKIHELVKHHLKYVEKSYFIFHLRLIRYLITVKS